MSVTLTQSIASQDLDRLHTECAELRTLIAEAGEKLRAAEQVLALAEGTLCAGCRGTSIEHTMSCNIRRRRERTGVRA